jgi:2-polyprenyl-6-methoxyphenol hydroxylase-like FAD-dependent oxidoreductase
VRDHPAGARHRLREEIETRWALGADGRASTVAKLLGLEKQRPLAGEMAFIWAYWRGLPSTGRFQLHVTEHANLSFAACEDDLTIVLLGVEPELTRGDAEQRQRNYVESLRLLPRRRRPRLGADRRRRPLQAPGHGAGHLRRDRAVAACEFFDSFSRRTRPKEDVITKERLSRWLAPVPASAT